MSFFFGPVGVPTATSFCSSSPCSSASPPASDPPSSSFSSFSPSAFSASAARSISGVVVPVCEPDFKSPKPGIVSGSILTMKKLILGFS